jgi:NNP family nitrate/nitrite transporter-like MFS transporter
MSHSHPQSSRALSLATIAFAINFSVWTLYAVLAIDLQERFALSSTELGIIFAVPMLSGALLRIPAGFLADRMNPKTLFILQMLFTAPSLFLLPYAQSIAHYLWIGAWIGISGTSFTIGIRYVTDWFSRSMQGTAMGIFGAGNAGAAITLALAPILTHYWGIEYIGPIYGIALITTALLFAAVAPDYPRTNYSDMASSLENTSSSLFDFGNDYNDQPNQRRWWWRLQVWRFGLYYYFVFGSFLALLMWLPQYYINAYGTSYQVAMALTLAFAASSSMVRALGGWFADRYGGRSVNWNVFWICLVCLFFLSYPPTTMTIHGIKQDVNLSIEVNIWVFTILILIIGIAQGFGRASVYKIIHDYYPNQMGQVGGFVAALGALGGATLPLAFGLVVDAVGIHSACFMLLYGVLAFCMMTMFFAVKADHLSKRVQYAVENNFLEQDFVIGKDDNSREKDV